MGFYGYRGPEVHVSSSNRSHQIAGEGKGDAFHDLSNAVKCPLQLKLSVQLDDRQSEIHGSSLDGSNC